MIGSIGFGELLLIGLVALIVFGPHRLPEIARKAGELMAKARAATKDFTDAIDSEYESSVAPIADLQNEYNATKDQLSDTASKLTDLTAIPPDADQDDPDHSEGPEDTDTPAGPDR